VKFATLTHNLTRTAMIIGVLLLAIPAAAQTHSPAPSAISACRQVVARSRARDTFMLLAMPYSELNTNASALAECGFRFRAADNNQLADLAEAESERYDFVIGSLMEDYLKGKGLWADFVQHDCQVVRKSLAGCGQ